MNSPEGGIRWYYSWGMILFHKGNSSEIAAAADFPIQEVPGELSTGSCIKQTNPSGNWKYCRLNFRMIDLERIPD